MIILKQSLLILFLGLSGLMPAHANEFVSPHCQPLVESKAPDEINRHTKGLLWKISRDNKETSYLYGTIHISDVEVTTLPDEVNQALHDSEHFVMEALPDSEQMLSLSRMMFFHDGRRLSEYVDKAIYDKTIQILSSYFIGQDTVASMKPWAAFLMMNYPPDQGAALDLVLLTMAQQNGASISGLESLSEQGEIFNQLSFDEQVQLLNDTVCHYDVVQKDFEIMKSLYLKRDLGGLYSHAQRFSMEDKPVYEKLIQKLIVDRNRAMVDRMQASLEKGKSFIAVGAMHLTGEEGVLALLEKQGYEVSAIF